MLQEHLYELIFREGEQTRSTSASSTGSALLDLPALGGPSDSGLSAYVQELESAAFELVAEVRVRDNESSVVQEQ